MEQIRNNFGRTFTKPIIVGSYFFFAIGVFAIIYKEYTIGPLLALAGAFTAFTSSGIVLDVNNKKYLKYIKYFGLVKSGKWKSLKCYRHISVINTDQTNISASSEEKKTYNVVLLNNSHCKRLVVSNCPTVEDAKVAAAELSSKINFDLVQYHPQVSAKTKRRRKH
jgi:hypothetical protein